MTVKINGKDWYSGEMSCEVVLQSYNFTESLTYSFNEFYIGPYERGTTITMEFISSHGSTKVSHITGALLRKHNMELGKLERTAQIIMILSGRPMYITMGALLQTFRKA